MRSKFPLISWCEVLSGKRGRQRRVRLPTLTPRSNRFILISDSRATTEGFRLFAPKNLKAKTVDLRLPCGLVESTQRETFDSVCKTPASNTYQCHAARTWQGVGGRGQGLKEDSREYEHMRGRVEGKGGDAAGGVGYRNRHARKHGGQSAYELK